MKIVVGALEFELSEPYAEGQVLSAGDAKNLNDLRGARIRGIIAKRLSRVTFNTPEEFVASAQEIARDLDSSFELKGPSQTKPSRYTLQVEIEEVARERALEYGGQLGKTLEGTALEEIISLYKGDARVIREAQRRMDARDAIANAALEFLQSDGE